MPPVKPLFQAFTFSGLPNNGLAVSTYNGVELPTQAGYTGCIYEDRAWRADLNNPRDFSGFADWVKALPENAVALIDLEPLANTIDARQALGVNARDLAAITRAVSELRARQDVKAYGYGLPFTAWTPATRGRTPALAEAADGTAVANDLWYSTIGVRSVLHSLAGLLVSVYVPWSADADTPGLYWQRFIRRTAAWCRDRGLTAIGCLCPTYTHTPEGLATEAALLPLDRWREVVAAVADEFDGGAVWYAPTAPYAVFRRHLNAAAAVWRSSVERNEPNAA